MITEGSIMVRPLDGVITASSTSAATRASSMNDDRPALVWRSANGGFAWVMIDLGPNPEPYNCIAIIGSNMRATDRLTYEADHRPDAWGGTPDYFSNAYHNAFVGVKDAQASTKTVFMLPNVMNHRYVRITITPPLNETHPDGYWEIQRFVVGRAVATEGMGQDAERSFEDPSIVTAGPNYAVFDEFPTMVSWKVKFPWVSDQLWRDEMIPLFTRVGGKRAILFVPKVESPESWQGEVTFGRIVSLPKATPRSYDDWSVEFTIQALAP